MGIVILLELLQFLTLCIRNSFLGISRHSSLLISFALSLPKLAKFESAFVFLSLEMKSLPELAT